MLLIAVAASLCRNRGNRYWSRYASEARLGNRFFGFYGYMSFDRKRAADLRLYRQQENVCRVYFKRDRSFVTGSPIAKMAKGPWALERAVPVRHSRPDRSGVRLCLPEGMGGGVRRGLRHTVCGGHYPAVPGNLPPAGNHGEIRSNADFLQDSFRSWISRTGCTRAA